jgi:hypothetical protein
MYCKKLDFEPLPQYLKAESIHRFECIIEWFLREWGEKKGKEFQSYSGWETSNNSSLAYIGDLEKFVSKYGETGAVSVTLFTDNLRDRVLDHYKDTDYFKGRSFHFQFIIGASYVAPHVDPRHVRTKNLVYVLKTGGKKVKTVFYQPKEHLKHLDISDGVVIPYENLDVVEEHILKEDCWYELDVSSIHSVENIESLRLMIQVMVKEWDGTV